MDLQTILSSVLVPAFIGGFGGWIALKTDVTRLEANQHNIQEDVREIKQDIKDMIISIR